MKSEFPILNQKVHGKKLRYLDSAATSQKPQQVIEKIAEYYATTNSNVHRGIHTLSEKATEEYERARAKVAKFLSVLPQEIVFTKGTTEGLNMLATILDLKSGDEVILSEMEHHANIVPWQQTKATLKFIPINADGTLDEKAYSKLLNKKTKVVSITHISNVVGTKNNVKKICTEAKKVNAITIIDGAQAAGHMPLNLKEINCDFYVFSGHKMYGPTGIGVLYGKEEQLKKLRPYQYGGGMIKEVTLQKSSFADSPWKFEAGTPPIAEAIVLGTAVEFLQEKNMQKIEEQEQAITKYAYEKLQKIKGMKILGPKERAALIAFTIEGIHPHDLAAILDQEGVAIRAGHHCAMPLAEKLGIPASARASFSIHTTKEDIDVLIASIQKAQEILK